ncbi:marine proteobacterial sortase target protein [Shewanella violacea]|uniref:Inter-alpha-trypsin inhibitor domain protein n=1 Tax=Shewanella violacea (strain JCM 10179 / CIP 106290 / LMG 19151 / DSS12) TaxID=637905 RepID=D4ZJG2_SHEVD|nr:marine proteobacterial sortase target protein [Shewanella violacea]BAJ01811.1 inter-alpha-trypsin inhibitor domain protein [Shewanella violacea DSS12]
MRTGSGLDNVSVQAPLMRRVHFAISGIAIVLASWINVAQALDAVEITHGSFVYHSQEENKPQVAQPLNTDVQMKVSGWINRVTVTQTFRNESDYWLNGSYLFPLPNEAAVDHMRLIVGKKIIEGQVREREEARKQFQLAKSRGQKTSLVEQSKPNIFTTSVANLGPGETLVVQISYQELVKYDKGEFSLRFPMFVKPRYEPKNLEGKDDSYPSTETILAQFVDLSYGYGEHRAPGSKVNIEIDLDAGVALSEITSVYHDIDKHLVTHNRYDLKLVSDTPANRDFVLRWTPVSGSEPVAAIYTQQGQTHKEADNSKEASDYALLMLIPPEIGASSVIARDLILVIDTSGSMSGEAIVQAKKAMGYALAGLGARDSFNVIAFNSDVHALSAQSLAATAKNIGRANQFIRTLKADGGTEMGPALTRALDNGNHSTSHQDEEDFDSDGVRLKQVLFMTDGAVANERSLFNLIEDKIGHSRLFTIGIGAAPNSHFMERAAEFGKGTFTYIGKLGEVQQKIESLLYKIEHPQVTDIELHYGDGTIPDHWPISIPDLYANEPLLVAIKMRPKIYQASASELIVSGMIGDQDWHSSLPLNERKSAAGLDLVWARKQIAALEMSKDGVNQARVKKQVTALGLKYHLVSQHTSLVAVETNSAVVSNYASMVQTTPFGWQAPVGYLPQTGGESRLLIMMGMILLGLGLAYLASFGLDKGAGLRQGISLLIQNRLKKASIQTRGDYGDYVHVPTKDLES